jgi:hypothetical protein
MRAVFDTICIRSLVTVFMFAGVALFLLPWFKESKSGASILLLTGGVLTVTCGFVRCYLDGTCGEKNPSQRRM